MEKGAHAIWDDVKAGPLTDEAEALLWEVLDTALAAEGVQNIQHEKRRHPTAPRDSETGRLFHGFSEDFTFGWEFVAYGEAKQ